MRSRKITQEQICRQEQILSGIAAQEPLPKAARKMLSVDGFRDLFLQIKDLYPNNIEAYEALEEQHIRIFGERKYSEYDSFRGSVKGHE